MNNFVVVSGVLAIFASFLLLNCMCNYQPEGIFRHGYGLRNRHHVDRVNNVGSLLPKTPQRFHGHKKFRTASARRNGSFFGEDEVV